MIFLKNVKYIDDTTFSITESHIAVEKGTEGKLRFVSEIPADAKQIIDCQGKYAMQAFACGHHHAYSALARGMNPPKKSPGNFYETLKYIWWTLDKSLDKDMIEASALATAIAAAKAGSTFVIDHHASPSYIEGSLDVIRKAFEKVGVGHLLCYEITDRDGTGKANAGLYETGDYLSRHQGLVGLHASFTVGNDTLKEAIELSQKYNSGLHIHVAEDRYDQDHCLINYGKRVVERLKDFDGLTSSKTILGHCLHLSDREKRIVANSPVYVVQNTESNLNNNVGYFDGSQLGERILLGTDGMHSDMLRSAKNSLFVGQGFDSVDFAGIYERFRNTHEYIKENNFVGDSQNNIVVFDYDSPTELNSSNFLGHFVFGLESRHITDVISDGKLIVKNGKMQTVDEAEIFAFTKEQGKRLWEAMSR